MVLNTPSETLSRICVAYPWSRECAGVAPIVPSPGEQTAIWNGDGGFAAASGKNIPNGTRCESIQLIPVSAIGKNPPSAVVQPDPNGMYMQIRSMPVLLTYSRWQYFL